MFSSLEIDFEKFNEPGLYLLLDDGHLLTFTPSYIEQMKLKYLNDPQLIPQSIREAPSYAPCPICPKRETARICHAIPSVFPFVEEMNRLFSFQEVLAIYRPHPDPQIEIGPMLHVARTSVQRALQYISILSLVYYCEVGQTYYKYFDGIIPMMDLFTIGERVYLNIFRDLGGDRSAIRAMMNQMHHEMEIIMHCQIQRLRLFCKSDSLLNAFANTTSLMTQFLSVDTEDFLRKRFEARNAPLG